MIACEKKKERKKGRKKQTNKQTNKGRKRQHSTNKLEKVMKKSQAYNIVSYILSVSLSAFQFKRREFRERLKLRSSPSMTRYL